MFVKVLDKAEIRSLCIINQLKKVAVGTKKNKYVPSHKNNLV